MKRFTHINATTIDEAVSALTLYGDKAEVLAGGAEMMGRLIYRTGPQPDYVINLKTIPGLDSITEEGGVLKIGALAKLHDIAYTSVVLGKWSVLAQAAKKVGTAQIRNMGTIGGNINQQVRCWYYWAPSDHFNCLRKDPNGLCYALQGDNRYQHSIFGASQGCPASNISDVAPALVALDASIVTSKQTIDAADFFFGFTRTILASDEIITEIQVPTPPSGSKQAFVKASIRKVLDFALASAAVVITPATGTITSARVVLGGVAPEPRRVTKAEDALVGNSISEAVADAAATAAVDGAIVLTYNRYKISVTKGVVKRAILA